MSQRFVLAMAAVLAFGYAELKADQADLVVQEFQKNGTLQWKNGNLEIPVRFKVKNQGSAATTVQVLNSVRVNSTDRWTGFMGTIAAGETKTINAIVKVADPSKLLAGRTLPLVAYADAPIAGGGTSIQPYGRVDESNDNNNTMALQVSVPGGFDLKADVPSPPQSRPSGFKSPDAVRQPKFIGKQRS